MIYLLLPLFVILLLLYRFAPAQVAAHAARANKPPGYFQRRRLFQGPIIGPDGKRIRTRGKLIGIAIGGSLPELVPDGSTFVATYLDDESRFKLNAGDVVVVNAKAENPVWRRLRVVKRVNDDTADFLADLGGKPHRTRPLIEIEAKVEWVVPS